MYTVEYKGTLFNAMGTFCCQQQLCENHSSWDTWLNNTLHEHFVFLVYCQWFGVLDSVF